MALLAAFGFPVVAGVHSALDLSFSPDGSCLAVTDATSHALVIVDPVERTVRRRVALEGAPSGLAWSSDGKQVFVSESGTHHIAVVDPVRGAVERRFEVGRYPRGLAVSPGRGLLLATDWGMDELRIIDLGTGESKARIPVGRQPTTVVISQDESLALVSNLIPATAATAADHAAELSLIDLQRLEPARVVRLPLGATNARGMAISGDGRRAYVAHALGRFNLPTTQLDRGWVNTNALSIIDLPSGLVTATVLLDQLMDGAADPWGVAIDPSGMRLYVTLSGVRQLAVLDLERFPEILGRNPEMLVNDLSALHRHDLIRRIDLPAEGPRGVAVSPDGRQLGIAGYFTGNVVLSGPDGAHFESISLGPQPEPDLVRRGEMVFHDAGRCYQRWLSCATCHPDARSDGLNWDLLNDGIGNPKNTRSMLLSADTPPAMSLGIRENMEVAARAGFVHIFFSQPAEEDVRAVIAYLRSLQPVTSPYRSADGSLTDSARRGEEIFHRPRVGCADCHPGPLFTDLSRCDVGTSGVYDRGEKRFDIPTLVELWRNPPYLHDGSVVSLREVLIEKNPDGRHGSVSSLESAEIDDLVSYLLSL